MERSFLYTLDWDSSRQAVSEALYNGKHVKQINNPDLREKSLNHHENDYKQCSV